MPRPSARFGGYASAGIDLVVAVLVVGGAGYWLDQRYWGGHGWGLGVGLVLGLAVGVRNLMRAAERTARDLDREEAEGGGKSWTVDESWVHKEPDASRPDEDHDKDN